MTPESRIRLAQVLVPLAAVFTLITLVAGDWFAAAGFALIIFVQVGVWRQARNADRSGLRVKESQPRYWFFKSAAFPILVIIVVTVVAKHLSGG